MLHLQVVCVSGLIATIPWISSHLKLLQVVISSKFVTALIGRVVNDQERDLLALPISIGGLGIVDPQAVSDFEFATSKKITFSLGYADSSARNVF